MTNDSVGLGWIEKLLALWIFLCIVIGLALGKYFPEFSQNLAIGIPIGLFLMIYPAMTKIELGELKDALKSKKQVGVIVFFNYVVNPFLLYILGYIFFEKIFLGLGWITPEAASYLWTGLILLGVAPCIAMVLVWTDLAKGNGPLGIVLMAWNSIIQVITTPFYIALLVGTYIAIDIGLIAQSVLLYLGLPLLFGVLTRREVIKRKGLEWMNTQLIPRFGALQLIALLFTMIVMFSLKGGVIIDNPNLIWQMAIPVILFFFLLFHVVYYTTRRMGYNYEDSATMGFHCTGRNFELAIAIALTAFATMPMVAVSTVVGPLIEIPVMLAIVWLSLRRRDRILKQQGNAMKNLMEDGKLSEPKDRRTHENESPVHLHSQLRPLPDGGRVPECKVWRPVRSMQRRDGSNPGPPDGNRSHERDWDRYLRSPVETH